MRYAKLKLNDTVNTENGICVSLWTQGCPHMCKGCFNSETWEKEGGQLVPTDLKGQIIKSLCANGIQRNFSVLGGEPLADWNLHFVQDIVTTVRIVYPHIKIYLWTGYTIELLKRKRKKNEYLDDILNNIDVLIDGKYENDKRDITLPLRGSSNQRILKKDIDF